MAGPDIICAGMITADILVQGFSALPPRGQTGGIDAVSIATGGDAINQAMSLAKLGNRVGLMGLVGGDVQGRLVLERCKAIGVAAEAVAVDPALATATGIVLIDGEGERSFLAPRNSTMSVLGPAHMKMEALRPGLRALSIGSLFWAADFDRQAVVPLLRRARALGAITVADMVTDQLDYGLDGLAEAWPLLDYVVPSELEGRAFTGSTEPARIAAALRGRGVGNVVVKRGAMGATAFAGDAEIYCPSFKVAGVDTTGAGDNFVAGLVHALVRGVAIDRAMRFGAATAALSIQAVGAGAGLKDLAQVEAFLAMQAEVGRTGPTDCGSDTGRR